MNGNITKQPDIKRYNAICKYTAGNVWEGTEQFNTLGTVNIAGNSNLEIGSSGLFTENKTIVKYSVCRNAAILVGYLETFNENEIMIAPHLAATEGDIIIVEINVFNN